MLHPAFDLKYISAEEGLGVVATRFVPKGTMTSIETDLDMVLSLAEMAQLDQAHQELIKKFGYRKPTGEFFLDWDHARFVNHSFHNTEVFTTYEFGLAVRDVCFCLFVRDRMFLRWLWRHFLLLPASISDRQSKAMS
jgi:hypothetical protein